MRARSLALAATIALAIVASLTAAACSGGDSGPKATPTPTKPGPTEAIAQWVAENRNVGFLTNCADAVRGQDTGKVCVTLKGQRGNLQAYDMGPTFAQPTALVLVEERPEAWVVLSVENIDLSGGAVPGIPWPLQIGDPVLVVGLEDPDCLRIREQPSQTGAQTNCIPAGMRAIVQEGPVDADTFTWWRITGDGFGGWAAGTWLRLEDAIADALNPTPAATAAE